MKKKQKKNNNNNNKRGQIGTGVPVHLQSVPVHPNQNVEVAKVYRYTTNVYRYIRPVFVQIGFLTPNFVPFDFLNPSIL